MKDQNEINLEEISECSESNLIESASALFEHQDQVSLENDVVDGLFLEKEDLSVEIDTSTSTESIQETSRAQPAPEESTETFSKGTHSQSSLLSDSSDQDSLVEPVESGDTFSGRPLSHFGDSGPVEIVESTTVEMVCDEAQSVTVSPTSLSNDLANLAVGPIPTSSEPSSTVPSTFMIAVGALSILAVRSPTAVRDQIPEFVDTLHSSQESVDTGISSLTRDSSLVTSSRPTTPAPPTASYKFVSPALLPPLQTRQGSWTASSTPSKLVSPQAMRLAEDIRSKIVGVCMTYADSNECEGPRVAAPERVAMSDQVQAAMHTFVVAAQLHLAQFVCPEKGVCDKKKITMGKDCIFSWVSFCAGFPAPSVVKFIDLPRYIEPEIIGLANMFAEDSNFTSSYQATLFLNHLYGPATNGPMISSGPFRSLSVLQVSFVRVYLEPPEELVQWSVEIGAISMDEVPEYFGKEILSYYNSPLDPKFVAAFLTSPSVFTSSDITSLASRFHIPNISKSSPHRDIIRFRSELTSNPAIFSLRGLEDRLSIVKHHSWLAVIVNLFKPLVSSKDWQAFEDYGLAEQRKYLAEIAHALCNSEAMWHVNWVSAPDAIIAWAYDSFRLYNMFEKNPPLFNYGQMRQQILSALHWMSRDPGHRQYVYSQLSGLASSTVLRLRQGSSFEFGPADGPGKTLPLLGPATAENPRVRMTVLQGFRYENSLPRPVHTPTTSSAIPMYGQTCDDSDASQTTNDSHWPNDNSVVTHATFSPSAYVKVATKTQIPPRMGAWAATQDRLDQYMTKPYRCRWVFTLFKNDELLGGTNTIANSFRATDEYYERTDWDRDSFEIDRAFHNMYMYTRVARVRAGHVLLVLNPHQFFANAVERLRREDYSISDYSKCSRAHIYVDEVKGSELIYRMLLPAPTENMVTDDHLAYWPVENLQHTNPLFKHGIFVVRDPETFLNFHHFHFNRRLPAPPLEPSVSSGVTDTDNSVAPEPMAVPVPVVTPAVAPANPVNTPVATPPKKRPRSHHGHDALPPAPPPGEKAEVLPAPNPPVAVENESNKRTRVEGLELERLEKERLESPPNWVHASDPKRNFNKLACLNMTIPARPVVNTPRLCMTDWAAALQLSTCACQRGPDDCNNIHWTRLTEGTISYESIRYQVVHHFHKKPEMVVTCLAAVEAVLDYFPREKVPQSPA
eukprot:gene25759-32248_t